MRKGILLLVLMLLLVAPVSASEITAPEVPDSGRELMPDKAETFGEGLLEILQDALGLLHPDLKEAAKVCTGVIGAVLLVSVLKTFPGKTLEVAEVCGTVAIAALLLGSTNSLVSLGTETVTELTEYGKLLLSVMTAAMAAQGAVTSSAALYAGTALFSSILSALISKALVPMIYVFLALAAANSAVGEDVLKKLRDFVKWLLSWCLKIVLYVFTGYMAVTGVVSGTTDAASLKAAKLTISGVVPVVGGILSDASEAVLVSTGVIKNAAGVYGMLAVLAVCVGPFVKIGAHYLLLKLTGAVCGVFGSKRATELIGDFATAMGLLLAMTGSVCLLLLISTVCFLREVG